MSAAEIVTLYAHLMGNYKFQTSNYVLFVYDHCMTSSLLPAVITELIKHSPTVPVLTLPEEVEKIWSQPFTFASLLFYINRYITHCQFLILEVEFYETNWPISVCDRYVKFAGAATLSLVAIAELVLILRIYGLYLGNKYILAFLLAILSGQVIVMAWAVHFGIRVPLPDGFPGCVLTGSSSWFAGLWGAPLVTDTCIFALTLWRTLRYKRAHGFTSTIEIILRDGTIYFFAIFSLNLMNCLIYLLVVPDLKAMGASFSQIMTSILISRLQLNLRSSQSKGNDASFIKITPGSRLPISGPGMKSPETSTFFTIGNLGEEMEGSFLDTIMEKEEVESIELYSPTQTRMKSTLLELNLTDDGPRAI